MASSGSRQLPGIACEECRTRKIKCDRRRPSCSVCEGAGVVCHFNLARSQRGPRRGHIKALRSRIASLEGLLGRERTELSNADGPDEGEHGNDGSTDEDAPQAAHVVSRQQTPQHHEDTVAAKGMSVQSHRSQGSSGSSSPKAPPSPVEPVITEMIQAELDQLYFERVHPVVPIIHRWRYFSWARQQSKTEPRTCLQLAMWTLAASAATNFQHLLGPLSTWTRSKLEALEYDEQSVEDVTLEQTQAWLLITHYEFRYTHYHRAWITAGRAFRLIQMSKLHLVDEPGVSLNMLPEAWIETEEKRRTFWMAYCLDRFISVRKQWPLTLQEEACCARLPAPESDFQHSRPVLMDFLSMAIASSGQTMLPPFAETVVLVTLCGRSMAYKQHPPMENAYGSEASAEFWARHTWLYQITQKRLALLSLPAASSEFFDPMRLFTNMLANAAVIWLCNVMHERSRNQDEQMFFVPVDRYCVLQSACEIVELARTLTRSSFLTAHGFSPMILFLAASLLKAHPDVPAYPALMTEERQHKIAELTQALQVLGNGNNLAITYLQLLEDSYCGDPCNLCVFPDTSMPMPLVDVHVDVVPSQPPDSAYGSVTADPFWLLDGVGQVGAFRF